MGVSRHQAMAGSALGREGWLEGGRPFARLQRKTCCDITESYELTGGAVKTT
jgi:hypothetical protein